VRSGFPARDRDWRISPAAMVRLLDWVLRVGSGDGPADVGRIVDALLPRRARSLRNGALRGLLVLDAGAGSRYPLSRALCAAGAEVWAVDPRVREGTTQEEAPGASPPAGDAIPCPRWDGSSGSGPTLRNSIHRIGSTLQEFASSPARPPLFDAVLGRCFLGFPLRASAKRALLLQWRRERPEAPPPGREEMQAACARYEAEVLRAIRTCLRPGGWAILHSLEGETYSDPRPLFRVHKPVEKPALRGGPPGTLSELLADQISGLWILQAE
jgi:hypothetical protein